jgi:flagellar biosynthesis protein FlgN
LKHSSSLQLLAALNAELASLQNFVGLLEREQGMLMENHSDQLLELSEQKSDHVFEQNKLAEDRGALLLQHVPELSTQGIRTLLLAQCPQGLPVWEQIFALAGRAQQLNRITGELIQMKMRHNQQIFFALSNAANKANLYGANGRTDFSPGSGRSLGSG